ncbi:GcrA family cell cycle regulator [Methylobacterium sp. J-078]|nr:MULTISPECIES: GcrA family cell cycle regulator [Methylobacterium]MBY0260177.1 GcrA family cell cycle regulator [Methylobacterium sp.]MCJ2043328.1 GcrA family cell cycle regulator [Methylobacterium sp. J-078]
MSAVSCRVPVRRRPARTRRASHPKLSVGPRPRKTSPRAIRSMNQLVRMSQVGEADAIAEPSAELRVPFAQSGAFVCKFIIGEPNDRAVCCGAPAPDGKSWCAFHRRIVFEPARPGRLR